MSKQFYSIQEAADQLEVDYKVVYRLVREGKIPSSRVGWQYRMTQADLNTYLNAQRAVQRAQSVTLAAEARSSSSNGNGTSAVKAVEGGVTKIRARQMEQNVINRFNQKIRGIDTIRHPVTGKLLVVNNWEKFYKKSEDIETLMQALNTAFLDRTTLATTPRNTRVQYTLEGEYNLVLELRIVAHLETFCALAVDNRSADLGELMVVLDELEELSTVTKAVHLAGLASPTGWSEDAIAYIVNSGRGDSYSNPNVRVFLLDLRMEAIYYDELDSVSAGFASLFRMATEDEDIASLEVELLAQASDRNGVILSDFAREIGVSEELVLSAARKSVAQGNFRLIEDQEAGWIFLTV